MNQAIIKQEGREARDSDLPVTSNPYPRTSRSLVQSSFNDWEEGWLERDEELRRLEQAN